MEFKERDIGILDGRNKDGLIGVFIKTSNEDDAIEVKRHLMNAQTEVKQWFDAFTGENILVNAVKTYIRENKGVIVTPEDSQRELKAFKTFVATLFGD